MHLQLTPIEAICLDGHIAIATNTYDITREKPVRVTIYAGLDITLFAGSLEDCAAAYYTLMFILRRGGNSQGNVIDFDYWMKRTESVRLDATSAREIKKIIKFYEGKTK